MKGEKLYKIFLGIALLLFAVRLVTDIRPLAVIGALFLLASCGVKAFSDLRKSRQEKKATKGQKKKK